MTELTKLRAEVASLEARLREAEETLQAIRGGQIDAFVVDSPSGPRVYTLRSADHPYRVLVEEMHEAALTLSSTGSTLYANRRFAEMMDLPLEQIIGRTFRDFVANDTAALLDSMLAALPGKCEGFLHTTTRDVPVTFTASAIVVEELNCIAMVVTDLTEQKKREASLDAEKGARMRLEDANRAKDEFLITVSHELRTPLTAILGWSTMLRRHQLDEATEKIAYEAIDQSTRMQASLIDDLLDVSRIVTGKVRLNVETLAIRDIIDSAVAAVATSAAEKHVHISSKIEDEVPCVRGDAVRLQQVFWNLLTNAIKFTPEGGSVSLRAYAADNTVVVEVSDTGRGVAPDFIPYLFDRFSQEDKTTTREHMGLGVGLSVARDLVRLHAGTIKGWSAGEGQGTVFTVTLPAFAETKDRPDEKSAIAFERQPLAGLSILAVEDDPSTRTWLTRMLEHFGARVISAGSVREAMSVLEGHVPDVVLSDLAMPVEDGLALIAKLRVRDDVRATPAIALTAYGRPEDCRDILAAGFNRYLRKPVDAVDLVQAIHAVANERVRS